MDSSFVTSRTSTSWLDVFPCISRNITTRSGISPGFGIICLGAVDVVEGKECSGVISSDPAVNSLELSKTSMGP